MGGEASISILQFYILPTEQVFLVDVHGLGERAFSTPNESGLTLKSILESQLISKVIFDVRGDSQALYSQFGIKLAGAIDLQLMELATRSHGQKFLHGLAKCMDQDHVQTPEEAKARCAIKKRGKELFKPEYGGRFEVFNDRPLDPEIVNYCIQDVQIMPQLWEIYNAKLAELQPMWSLKVQQETDARLYWSQTPGNHITDQNMARVPFGW